jgi:hypothetical protein
MSEIAVPDYDGLLLDGLFLNAPAQVNRSGWTGKRKVVGMPGVELWSGRATVDTIATESEERPWRAFVFGLRGPQNWFRWPLPCHSHIGSKPLVGAATHAGYSLPLTDMQPNARILRAGQFMTVPLPSGHSRAVCLTADLIADGDGNGVAEFEPALGEIPDEGEEVETTAPFIPMSPTDSTQGFNLAEGISGASFAVEETKGAATGFIPTFDNTSAAPTFDSDN